MRNYRNETGLVRPYRPKPADFREVYLAMGWDGIDQHFRTNVRCIRRWIMEEGREGLKAERAAVVREKRRRRKERLGRGQETGHIAHVCAS